ncbi:MAG: cytochrome c biogenesis protein CcdA [Rubrobacter sp.]|nr:cytochrome c biogenesis protein CcdA [Rubrobacter sp.]
MSEVQAFLSELLSGLAAALPFGLAFGAGMVAAVNPCGFAMLPAYLSLYLGTEESGFAERSASRRALRALLVGFVVSSGFVLLFLLTGVVISAGGDALVGAMPVLGVLVGEALILLGAWMLLGRSLHVGIFGRLAAKLGDPRKVGIRGFFLFGIAYGAASLGCTLPAFLAVVGSGIAAERMASGATRFLGYGLGMASVLVALTLALAFFRAGLVRWLQGTQPYVQRASAILLVLAGAYVIFYWWMAPPA